MKNFKKITISLWLVLLAATPAFARQQADSSGILVWIFIGFCGLIVTLQLIPAVILGYKMIKEVVTRDDHRHDH